MSRRSIGRHATIRTRLRGAILAVALIFLIALTLLGISVMSISQQELTMAGQFLRQGRVQMLAENCLKTAEASATAQVDAQLNHPGGTLPRTPGLIDVANGMAVATIGDSAWWDDPTHTLPCSTGGRYVLEYLGRQDIVLPEDRYTGRTHSLHAFRITARGTAGNEVSVVLQTLFLRNGT